ncbi:MAG TPA: YihY/virulence factor BrkB family protein, partial [Candidatus Limnocylindrales bacterium]
VEETRPFPVKTGTALGLTILAGVGIIGSFVSIVGASLLTNEVVARLGLDRSAVNLASLLRWPLVFTLLSGAVAVLYHWAPNFRAPWRACLIGGALFSIVWILATWLFALYVANFANYANTYGALGGVIALMLWLYLSATLLISAAALVAAALKELRPTTVRERRVDRGVQGSGAQRGRPTEGATAWSQHTVATESRAVAPPAVPVRRARRSVATSTYRMSGPGDWALAGVVAAMGIAFGALAAWALEPDRRT